MTFTSSIFLIGLLPWFLLLFGFVGKQKQTKTALLVLMNSIFYIWGGIGAFFFVCIFALCVWGFCKIMMEYKKKSLFVLFLILTVIPLLRVKYTGFVIGNINSVLGSNLSNSNIIIPLGISFFTFEAISLLSDVYSGKITEEVSVLDVYTYLTFFPTVTSGPIMRFEDFKKGFGKGIETASYNQAIERVLFGLCKKVLIADKLAILANYYFQGIREGRSFSCAGLWIGSIAYSLQLYFDFSGYSDMAIGMGKMLGFDIPENFNNPYRARSISDFWKRWHITLSRWFRDYIYISLGGNRGSVFKHIRNLLIVWIVTGVWHGAGWSFLLWGMGYFVLLTLEKYIPFMKKIGTKWYGRVYALFFINLLWVPFRADSLTIAVKYLAGMFGIGSGAGIESRAVAFLPYLLGAVVLCLPLEKVSLKGRYEMAGKVLKGIGIIVFTVFALCAVISATYTTYIYGTF